jgi:hypothetical protein
VGLTPADEGLSKEQKRDKLEGQLRELKTSIRSETKSEKVRRIKETAFFFFLLHLLVAQRLFHRIIVYVIARGMMHIHMLDFR